MIHKFSKLKPSAEAGGFSVGEFDSVVKSGFVWRGVV